ncbi:MAG: RIP metalloprotease RseP [Ignavibacteria bacterium RBG_13_36_8]|nr:MAG: RIP metalloprotease RseP [Ignavibacteria bacterium RBG_13_36_8]
MDYIIYFAITIGILVFVHEFGHFAAAKLSKMRVDTFAIGFGRRLFGWNKLTGFTFGPLPKDFDGQGNTDYRLSLLPLGGYVKIAGMIDESFDTKFIAEEPKDWEFRSKPTYKKLFVISAGVIMNIILTLLIFWGMNFLRGKQIINTTEIGIVSQESDAADFGFQSKDKIISINGFEPKNWDDIVDHFLVKSLGRDINVEVIRGNETIKLHIDRDKLSEASKEGFFINYGRTKPLIANVLKDSPASDAGIESGDLIVELNGVQLNNSEDVTGIISSNKETTIPIVLLRDLDTISSVVTPDMTGKIGISLVDVYAGPIEYRSYGFFESLSQSVINMFQYTILTYSLLKNVIVGNIAFNQAFGGPVKIAQIAARSAESGIMSFIFFLAILSLSLAIINILPLPVFDGGHFVIILIEGIIKRELPVKVKIAIQNVGFVLILLLMAFIIYSDIISL